MDDEKKSRVPQPSAPLDSDGELERNAEVEEFFRKLMDKSDMRRPKPSPEAIAAALQAMQRLGVAGADDEAESDPEAADQTSLSAALSCPTCGYTNQPGNRFCGMCGRAVQAGDPPDISNFASEEGGRNHPPGPHHYHHHYHHHYLANAQAGEILSSVLGQKSAAPAARDSGKTRTPLSGAAMSRTEAALRQMTQDWALACNNKQLDDLLEFYSADALVLRPNLPPIRGTTAIREFFFSALDSGLGDLEVEPLRVELLGEVAYEAGRCKMLVPIAVGKRREERGKYVVVFAKQKSGEWKAVVDSWSTDLNLAVGDISAGKTASPQPPRR